MSTEFQSAFEAAVPAALQIAYDYVDHHKAVETIWIVAYRDGDWASAFPVYKISGQVVIPYYVTTVVPSLDNSIPNQQTLLEISDLLVPPLMIDTVNGPTRIVVRYDVAAQTMNADFYYEPLRMGPDDTLTELYDAWVKRLQETGNDSAAD